MGFNFSFFNTQEHRVFNYKPRYYDPEKEEMKKKFGHVDGSAEKEQYTPGSYIKGSLRDGNYQKTRGGSVMQKVIGMAALAIFFVFLVFLVRFFALLW